MTTNTYTIKEYTRNEEGIIEYTGRECQFIYDTDYAITLDQAATDVANVKWADVKQIEYTIS